MLKTDFFSSKNAYLHSRIQYLTFKKYHICCEMTQICVYKVETIITLQADFIRGWIKSNIFNSKIVSKSSPRFKKCHIGCEMT
jgi:hypothetical protein